MQFDNRYFYEKLKQALDLGAAGLLYKLFWRLLPGSLRQRLSSKISAAQSRGALAIPKSHTWVYPI